MPDDHLNGDLDNIAETSHRRNRVGCASETPGNISLCGRRGPVIAGKWRSATLKEGPRLRRCVGRGGAPLGRGQWGAASPPLSGESLKGD